MPPGNPSRRQLLRRSILRSIPQEPSQYDAVAPQFVYLPLSHLRALDPDAMLVVGIRGAGKSFWWYALQNPELREVAVGTDVEVSAGFGVGSSTAWPDKDEVGQLLRFGFSPRLIWKSVLLRQIAPQLVPSTGWPDLLSWVTAEPSKVAEVLRETDGSLAHKNSKHVVLFDALDRTADEWDDRQNLLRGLLELALELRSFRRIRAKAFVRPDMLDDPKVKAFPDASKVVASRVKLDWNEEDLYGLFFRYLANGTEAEAAAAFRELTTAKWDVGSAGWTVPKPLRTDERAQENVFVQLAGPWMGTDKRRGKTYTWVPNHLADASGSVSPRSFLAAMRRAAEQREVNAQEYPLHWTGLQEGVRAASEYRVLEIGEDLPWAYEAMQVLKDVVVPCEPETLQSAWKAGRLTQKLAGENARGLPSTDPAAVLAELAKVGILAYLPDGRINIPDVYRVGFGLRRKGGFAPH